MMKWVYEETSPSQFSNDFIKPKHIYMYCTVHRGQNKFCQGDRIISS